MGIQIDADARIFYVHMDDLKRCTPPDPTPSWPDVVCGTFIILSTRAPSTTAPTNPDPAPTGSDNPPLARSDRNMQSDVGDARASTITDQTEDSPADTNTPARTNWDLQDENCILSRNSTCCIDFKGFRFHFMETLLCALELEMLGDTKHISQLARYTRMEYVRKCVNTRLELASSTLQDTEEYIICSIVLTTSPCIDNQYYLRVTIRNWVTLTRAGKQQRDYLISVCYIPVNIKTLCGNFVVAHR